jgi:ParB family chromosome partitioning protein
LIHHFGLTHEQAADRVGVDRVTITNILRLLDLHTDAREMIRRGQLTAGHGRALLGLADRDAQAELARRAVAGGWSVRMVESAVQRTSPSPSSEALSPRRSRSAHLADLSRQIGAQLQTKVHVRSGRKKGAGSITIEFFTLQQFDQLLGKLGVRIE